MRYRPVAAVISVVQRGLDAAVRLDLLVHLWGHAGSGVLISECLTLAVRALGAQVRTVCHLILLQDKTAGSELYLT